MARLKDSVERTMFYNASPLIFERAKILRNNLTNAEKILWSILNSKKMLGLHFRRQHPINRFIADFYCHSIKLVIEVDGGIHQNKERKEYDISRNAEIEKWGIKVLRFSNDQVFSDIDSVRIRIETVCKELMSTLPSK
jgi:very-short-patch-repair endonuclease